MFRIYDEQKNIIDFPDGVTSLDIFISSMRKERNTESVEGSNRNIDYGAVYKEREIQLNISMHAQDTQSYRLLRNEVYALFDDVAYVSEEYDPGKIYEVRIDSQYIPERINGRVAKGEIECSMPGLPFAESIGTTQDIEQNGLRYSQELWSYGMGLSYDDDSQKYTNKKMNFAIFNAGDIGIHPFEQYLKIEFENIGKGYRLINETTGDKFEYLGRTTGKFVLDGPNMTMKGLQAFRDTNRQYISLAPGWNYFNQNKAKEVKFDFKYYYK